MMSGRNSKTASTAILSWMAAFVVVIISASACGKLDDNVNQTQEKIVAALKAQGIYERNNLPEDRPTPEQIKGWFDITRGGAYRYVLNEQRENRDKSAVIAAGDSISFYFDARIFISGSFESQQTFYTNIASRIAELTSSNPDFTRWSTERLKIKVGEDPRILKSLQEALISCRAGDGNPDNDEDEDGIASDRVRVYLTPNIAFGNRIVYNVPANSALVFEVTEIEIIK